MGKSHAQKQVEQNDIAVQQQQMAFQNQQAQLAAEQTARQNALQQSALETYKQYQQMVNPFAQSALDVGTQALNGQVPQGLANALLAGPRQQLSADYAQAGNNLTEALGRNGLSGTGLSAGPLASLYSKQAGDVANLTQNANLQALQMGLNAGFQGANVASGQQSLGLQSPGIYNPLGYGSQAIGAGQAANVDPRQFAGFNWGGLFGGLAGAGLNSIPGLRRPSGGNV